MSAALRLSVLLLILFSCATFKELEPNPAINSKEAGFIEIKDDQEVFELAKDKQYFMKMPRPTAADFYLVFDIDNKENYKTYLTRAFDDGEGEIIKIEDAETSNSEMIVFPIDAQVPTFYWVIDKVLSDKLLNVKYRYVPKWRYTYENESQALKEKLASNKLDNAVFDSFSSNFDYSGFDYTTTFNSITQKSTAFKEIESKMNEISALMPSDISQSDAAVVDYNQLDANLKGEIKRLNKFTYMIDVFNKFKITESSDLAFINESATIVDFLNNKEGFDYDPALVSEIKRLSSQRLARVQVYIESDLRNKNTVSPIDYDVANVKNLSELSSYPNHSSIVALDQFVSTYNSLVTEMSNSNQQLDEIEKKVSKSTKWPSNNFYSGVASQLSTVENKLNSIDLRKLDPYATYNSVRLIKSSVRNSKRRISSNRSKYARAAIVVQQINQMRPNNQYKQMIDLLKQNNDLTFLRSQYAELDDLSMNHQKAQIDMDLNQNDFAAAENKLRQFYGDQSYLNLAQIRTKKTQLVNTAETNFYSKILTQSKANADSVVNANIETFTGVKELYEHAAFKPVHNANFSSSGPQAAQQKMNQLQIDLDQVKTVSFPEKAIEVLYSSFVRNIRNNGVEKAKSIVVHGDNYKGKNSRIWRMVNECDTRRGKRLNKQAEYRKIFTLPTNDGKQAENEYVVKVNMNFESTAKFPVYELNIKLPDEVAENSTSKQWYKSLKMNSDVIKNEGRITISAPTSANNYECQISPVRAIKDKTNIFEIKFTHPEYVVFEVSVMAQRPLIKRN